MAVYIWTNLINRTNGVQGCMICNPYKAYKTNRNPIMEEFVMRKTNLITNRIRDGDFCCEKNFFEKEIKTK